MKPIVVAKLRVESVTGKTCYAGENGFSALIAYVAPEDPLMIEQLRNAQTQRSTVTIRCGAIEIAGRVGNLKCDIGGMSEAIAISVDDLRYFKPEHNADWPVAVCMCIGCRTALLSVNPLLASNRSDCHFDR